MSHFITPITIAAVSTLLFFFLSGKLEGSSIRYKISTGMMLVGLWMVVAAGSVLYIAMRIPANPAKRMTLETLTNFALFSLCFTLVGFLFLVLGVLVLAWRYSFDTVERTENPRQRQEFDSPQIEGGLAAVPVPAVPMYRTGRRRFTQVDTDWPSRSA